MSEDENIQPKPEPTDRHDKSSDSTGWRSPANVIALIALVGSLVSVGISVRGCLVADRSLEFGAQSFRAERTLVLQGRVQNEQLHVLSVDPTMFLQRVSAYFPSSLDRQDYEAHPPDFGVPLVNIRVSLQSLTERMIPRKPGFVRLSDAGSIPVVFRARFTAKGEAYDDLSLYSLPMMIVVPDTGVPTVQMNGLVFIGHLAISTDPREFVDRVWQQSFVRKGGA